ncbi:hypothetical protein Tco_0033869 [Tanacetum coccineum]
MEKRMLIYFGVKLLLMNDVSVEKMNKAKDVIIDLRWRVKLRSFSIRLRKRRTATADDGAEEDRCIDTFLLIIKFLFPLSGLNGGGL